MNYWTIPGIPDMVEKPIEKIHNTVCQEYGFTPDEIKRKLKIAPYVQARTMVAFIALNYSGYSQAAIARYYKSDPTTIKSNIRKFELDVKQQPALKKRLQKILITLKIKWNPKWITQHLCTACTYPAM